MTYGNHKEPEGDSPSVAQAKRVLDTISESLAPEPDAAEAILAQAEKTPAAGTKVCSYHKTAEPLANFASNAAHGDHLQSACKAAEKIRRDARKKAAK